jgi:hypothetical protein
MTVDWQLVASQAVDAMKGVLSSRWEDVAALAAFHANQIIELGKFIEENKSTLDPEVYQHLIEEHREYITANLGGLVGIASVVARQAANAAMRVLVQALSSAAGLPVFAL